MTGATLNTSNDCVCDFEHYYQPISNACTLGCSERCPDDCMHDKPNFCMSCIENFFLFTGTMVCLEVCPTGFVENSTTNECDLVVAGGLEFAACFEFNDDIAYDWSNFIAYTTVEELIPYL